jgi:hypothetical protein
MRAVFDLIRLSALRTILLTSNVGMMMCSKLATNQ